MQKFQLELLPSLIKRYRKLTKTSQEKLARKLKISRKSLCQYEIDSSKMQLELFHRLLNMMNENGEFKILMLLDLPNHEFEREQDVTN
jgi:DNA-binding XRE family transcriptional regulator